MQLSPTVVLGPAKNSILTFDVDVQSPAKLEQLRSGTRFVPVREKRLIGKEGGQLKNSKLAAALHMP